MNNQKFTFDKIVVVFAVAVIIIFAIFRNAQITKQNEMLNYPAATEFNYK